MIYIFEKSNTNVIVIQTKHQFLFIVDREDNNNNKWNIFDIDYIEIKSNLMYC